MSIVYLTIVFRFPKSNLAQVSVFKWNLCWPILHCTLFSLLRRIIKHRKMKESKKTTFPNPLSISKNSINCYSVMYWILNLHARILLCKHSDLAILFFFFSNYMHASPGQKNANVIRNFYGRECFKVMFECNHRHKYSFQSFFNSTFPSCW